MFRVQDLGFFREMIWQISLQRSGNAEATKSVAVAELLVCFEPAALCQVPRPRQRSPACETPSVSAFDCVRIYVATLTPQVPTR